MNVLEMCLEGVSLGCVFQGCFGCVSEYVIGMVWVYFRVVSQGCISGVS